MNEVNGQSLSDEKEWTDSELPHLRSGFQVTTTTSPYWENTPVQVTSGGHSGKCKTNPRGRWTVCAIFYNQITL